ncbi:MAG: hypothetical protein NVSMB47_07970 [Polyangiales bacterium]
MLGLIADDPRGYTAAHDAWLVDLVAPRGERVAVRSWLRAAAAIEGFSSNEGAALVEVLLAKSGLLPAALTTVDALGLHGRALVALVEAALVAHRSQHATTIVVPEPPIAWPARTELRRAAMTLLAGAEVVLHAREAWELVPLVGADFIVDETGGAIAPPQGARSILTRVFGTGAPYEAWLAALATMGVQVAGGPIAHVLAAPSGVGPREILGAAHRAGLDVLEVRDAFEG